MPGIDIFATVFAASFLLALAPGPDNIFVLAQSALFGEKAGIITSLGLFTGVLFHIFLVSFGVAIIFQTSPLAFNALKITGALYLVYLAWQAFRAGSQKLGRSGSNAFIGYLALYRRGIIMNITNPKVALFFLAFLPQFCIQDSMPMPVQIILFGVCFIAAAFLVFIPVAVFGGRLAGKFNSSPRAQVFLNRVAACVFLGLAFALFASH